MVYLFLFTVVTPLLYLLFIYPAGEEEEAEAGHRLHAKRRAVPTAPLPR